VTELIALGGEVADIDNDASGSAESADETVLSEELKTNKFVDKYVDGLQSFRKVSEI